jgi:hypothetical protein
MRGEQTSTIPYREPNMSIHADLRGRPDTPLSTLRGDDALARAASGVADPRRRLLAGLRHAHAEATLRAALLRQAATPHPLLPRLVEEAEEQLRRLEQAFALLRERPGRGIALHDGADLDTFETATLVEEERRGAAEAATLRDLAHTAGQHMVARLLDLTAEERVATARALAATARAPRGDARH